MPHWPSNGSACVSRPEPRVSRAVLEGHQPINTQPNQFIAIPCEHGRGALVDIPDHPGVIHYQDGVRRGVEDFSEQCVGEHDAL